MGDSICETKVHARDKVDGATGVSPAVRPVDRVRVRRAVPLFANLLKISSAISQLLLTLRLRNHMYFHGFFLLYSFFPFRELPGIKAAVFSLRLWRTLHLYAFMQILIASMSAITYRSVKRKPWFDVAVKCMHVR